MRFRGTITVWNSPRQFGFVLPAPEVQAEYGIANALFIHVTNFPLDQAKSVRLGAEIEFEIGDPVSLGKKPQAVNARILSVPAPTGITALLQAVR